MASDYRLEFDGDLWRVFIDGEHFDCFASIGDACFSIEEHSGRDGCLPGNLRELLVAADSELSAIAHGRLPSEKSELLRMSTAFRDLYERRSVKP